MLKIDFEYPSKRGGRYEGSLLVSPEEKWTLYEYRQTRGAGLRKGTISYEGSHSGFPIPKRVTHSAFKLAQQKLEQVETFDFQDIRFSDLPEREFTLAAFGFPDVLKPATTLRASHTGYWLVGLALLSLSVAIAFKVASTRLQKAAG